MLTEVATQQVFILRRFAASTRIFDLQNQLDRQAYTCHTYDFNPTYHSFSLASTCGDHHAEAVAAALEQQNLHHVVLVAHGIDSGLAKRVIALAPERIAGLLLVGLAPSQPIAAQPTPTLVLTSAHTPELTTRLFQEHIANQLPNSECVPFVDDSLLNLDRSCAPVAEVLHAFCSLRLPSADLCF